jgi:hypothetical protein
LQSQLKFVVPTQFHDRGRLIGAGVWGRQHARIFGECEDVEFCAVVGRSPERTAARAAEYGVRSYLDVAEMLVHEKPDLVAVCPARSTALSADLAGHCDAKTVTMIKQEHLGPLNVQ